MAQQPGALYDWPWQALGSYKYVVLAPLAARAVQSNLLGGPMEADNFSAHMLLLVLLRLLLGHAWMLVSRWPYVIDRYQIQRKGVSFKQMDREENWDDFIILHALLGFFLHDHLPYFHHFSPPQHVAAGMLVTTLLHVGPVEYLYYWLHRALHHHFLYSRYHSHHHASFVTEPVTGTVHPFAEHLMYCAVFFIPIYGTALLGLLSVPVIYFYLLAFDFLNLLGHCNFECFPLALFQALPALKYIIYTPSFHSLHHSQVHTNFCLFMPIYDYLAGTADPSSDALHAASRKGIKDEPDFVFLGHGINIWSILHMPYYMPFFAARPFALHLQQLALTPLALLLSLLYWLLSPPFIAATSRLRAFKLQTWSTPRMGISFFLPWEKARVNALIESAILSADKAGVKVFALGALNKNEHLNGGGTLFLSRHPSLRLRLVHGNTLTAAVILHGLPPACQEVLLAGATSKLGRAIALYLANKGTRVLMLTSSSERYDAICMEAAPPHRHLLVHITHASQAKHCREWIVGRWLSRQEQEAAPAGTHFHQFVVPPMAPSRPDCTYGSLAAMRLPHDMEGLHHCEFSLPRGVVHACHAGGLVHLLEGWQHHEIGPIDVARIDVTWQAAMRHGFQRA